MATKKKQKRFHLYVRGANVQGECFKNGDSLRVEPREEIVNGCLACMRIGRVGNQHTWRRQVGRYFEGKRGRRTFRLLDQERTILDLRREELAARVRGERVDIFRIPYVVHETPHAIFLHQTWFEWDDGKLYGGSPQRESGKRKAA
jgi:hypothetical protein